MIELDPNRSFEVQRLEREVRHAKKEFELQETKLKEAQAKLDAELAKQKK